MTTVDPIKSKTINVLLDGKVIGVFCHSEGTVDLENQLISHVEPSIKENVFQLAVTKDYADFLTLEDE